MVFNFGKPDARDLQAFLLFYDQHAPQLWGRILAAGLSTTQAKTILIKTFVKAWRHSRRSGIREDRLPAWLLSLAYTEGLPADTVKVSFEPS